MIIVEKEQVVMSGKRRQWKQRDRAADQRAVRMATPRDVLGVRRAGMCCNTAVRDCLLQHEKEISPRRVFPSIHLAVSLLQYLFFRKLAQIALLAFCISTLVFFWDVNITSKPSVASLYF